MLPPKRSLRSWIILSNGEASKLEEEEDEEKEEDIFFYDKLDNRSETKPMKASSTVIQYTSFYSIYPSRSSDQYWTAECISNS